MTSTTATKRDRGGCGGDGCGAEDTWPLHNVRHRGVFCRLCTSCVLKYHPGSFCTGCFHLFDGSQPSDASNPVIHCSSCPSLSHTACLPSLDHENKYLCPTCANPNGFSFFPVGHKKPRVSVEGEEDEGKRDAEAIDLEFAKVLLVAAQIAAATMNKAVAGFRAEAERKVKEAVLAKRRAKEMLERVVFVANKDREKMKGMGMIASPVRALDASVSLEVVDAKKRLVSKHGAVPAGAAALAAQKRIQSREREKLMKFQDPIPLAKVLPPSSPQIVAGLVVGVNQPKGSSIGDLPSPVGAAQNNNSIEQEKQKNEIPFSSQSSLGVNEEKRIVEEHHTTAAPPQIPSLN